MEGEIEGDKHWCDRETLISCLGLTIFVLQNYVQPTEPHWPGQELMVVDSSSWWYYGYDFEILIILRDVYEMYKEEWNDVSV